MQTFLPYESFYKSAKCLDMKRLGKQRVEAWQILTALQNPSYGWQNHPAVNMWRGYEKMLTLYGITICHEWISRGYKDTILERFINSGFLQNPFPSPPWLGNKAFHDSHKSKLLQKAPEWYIKFNWNVPVLEYVWPV